MNNSIEKKIKVADVAIVGGGTAGLALAAELKRSGINQVIVLERESEAGGIPRHCGHYPFGVREYSRLLKGPQYAAKNTKTALDLGVEIRTQTTVTKLHKAGRLSLSTPDGLEELYAKRVVLCTGVRESSRSQRFISGQRPLGVMSTGALQSMIYLKAMRPFLKPVILGSELVSFSAIDTCRHAGIKPVAMVEEQTKIIARKILQPYLTLRGVPLYTRALNPKIIGDKKVEALTFYDASGSEKTIETDGVIISGRFRPEAALLYSSHLELDQGSGGPKINQFGQCSDPAYYAAGNLLRPAETSRWCWHEGIATAKRIIQDLENSHFSTKKVIDLKITASEIKFILPQQITLSQRPDGLDYLQIGLATPARGTLKAMFGGQPIWSSPINSRPVRRILRPFGKILDAVNNAQLKPESEIQFQFEPR